MSSQLDEQQILQRVYNASNDTFKVSGNTIDAYDVIYSGQTAAASINASSGATTQLVASSSASISLVVPNEQTGVTINFYTGPNGTETLKFTIAPGQDNEVPVQIPAGTRISIRSAGSAPSSGSITLTLCG